MEHTLDKYLFHEGKNFHAYEFLGSFLEENQYVLLFTISVFIILSNKKLLIVFFSFTYGLIIAYPCLFSYIFFNFSQKNKAFYLFSSIKPFLSQTVSFFSDFILQLY